MSDQQINVEQSNLELKIIIEVSARAEQLYADSVKLGDHAAFALKKEHRSQLTGLENIAESTFKAVDIFDYIKRQTARDEDWREPFPSHSNLLFGQRLLEFFENKVRSVTDLACNDMGIADKKDEEKQLRRRIYLLLIRQCIHQLVIQYEYRVNVPEDLKLKGV